MTLDDYKQQVETLEKEIAKLERKSAQMSELMDIQHRLILQLRDALGAEQTARGVK